MIYLLLAFLSALFGSASSLGAATLLRPLLDAVSGLPPVSVALLCTMAALCASLIGAFFALSQPLPLEQEELLFLAAGAAVGGVLGDLLFSRFAGMLSPGGVRLLQNALLFTLLALPGLYFSQLSRTLRPLSVSRIYALPVALCSGLFASFLAFGAEPVTLTAYYLLFDAEDGESAVAALTVSLFAMAGKLVSMLIRLRLQLPDADVLIWLLPGAILGALLAMLPLIQSRAGRHGGMVIRLSLFAALINVAAVLA